MSNIKRVEWIDEAKALAIILVGVGHYSCPEGLLTWIYTFHMPLFFILSGITSNFEKYPFKEFFLKKVRTLLFPWVIAVVINVVFQNLCMLIGYQQIKYI